MAPPPIKSGTYCASGMVAITPNNSTDLPIPVRGLYVGVGGDVACAGVEGGDVILKNVASGQVLPIQIVRVKVTGTTATDLIGLY